VLGRVLAVWSRHARVYSGNLVSNVTPALLEPVFLLLTVGLGLGKFVDVEFAGLPYPKYLAAGVLGTTALYTASFESTYGTYVRMTFQRTYAAMLATPLTRRDVVLGEILFCGTKGLLFTSIVCAVLAALGLIGSWGALAVPLIGFSVSTAFAGIGLFVVTLVKNMNHFQLYFTVVLTPMISFSGVMFPVSSLPEGVRYVAYAFPLFHAVESFRWAVAGPEHLTVPWGRACPLVLVAWAGAAAWFGGHRFAQRLRA
jgi:lipooligosaccharide transport system permease protein